MEKRGWLKWRLVIPAVILTIGLTSCPGDVDLPYAQDLTPVIGPEGGVVNGFEGDVVMVIPAGALKEQVKFSMHEVLYKSTMNEAEFLKTFVIEPSVVFNVPVTLNVKWDGCLSNGCIPCDEMEVFFCTWCNLSAYCQNMEGCRFTCCVDVPNGTISACIGGTGVIATIGKAR